MAELATILAPTSKLLWLIPALPLLGFLVLAICGRRMVRAAAAIVGVGSVGLSAAVTIIMAIWFIDSGHAAWRQTLWTWISVGGFQADIGLRLDSLSLVMVLVVTFVGFLIHLYSAEFMRGEEGYSRFFAYMNLFVAAMLTLVLADNLLALYLGWEGVGLCSYLLIGFWYADPANGRAARKAFIVTRVGDAAMAVGLFLLFAQLGTLDIQELMQRASAGWLPGSALPIAAAALLLAGAVGKSAQLPLQTWLPDAMAGPTPVSALIHAATMVTAGVYLIARTHVLFELAPPVRHAVAVIGAATLLLAGFSALAQRDIKRVLAYSTISQIGYMFLALGVGAYSAAMFHFMTHAFFKALLFLAAGAVILAMGHEHDMFKMGGLRRRMPLVFVTFFIGAASLSALPLVTAGFYSKDEILFAALASPTGGAWLYLAGLAGALLTSIYTFRMVFLTFFGRQKRDVERQPGVCIAIVLVVLAALSIDGGFVQLPPTLGNWHVFSDVVGRVFPPETHCAAALSLPVSQIIASVVSIAGIVIAWWFFLARPAAAEAMARNPLGARLHRFWFFGWGFDRLYDVLFVRPILWAARVNRDDAVDFIYQAVAWLTERLHRALSLTQTGRLRWYVACVAAGAIGILLVVVLS